VSTAGAVFPVNMDRAGLLAVLDDIRERVASGDSLEGRIQWTLPEQVGADPASYDVTARYRTGSIGAHRTIRVIGIQS
jgi:hypothetical protein